MSDQIPSIPQANGSLGFYQTQGQTIVSGAISQEFTCLKELLQRSFDMLQKAEAYFVAATNEEITSPPFERGQKFTDLLRVRYLLADIQQKLSTKV